MMVASIDAPGKMVGKPLKRREDPRLISGAGQFIDDLRLPGMLHIALVRSPYAHAKIERIDTSAAKSMPGVVAVYTGDDFMDLNPMPAAWQAAGCENHPVTPRVLAVGEVHLAGDPVAVVVAETPYQARDAAQAVAVDYDELPVVVDAKKAAQVGAPQLHEEAPNNIVFEWSCGKDAEVIEQALAGAEIRTNLNVINQRLIPTAIDPRGTVARFDPGTGDYTLWATHQAPHVLRLLLAAFVLGIPEQKIRTIAPDIGGGFGSKIDCYYDIPLAMAISKKLGGRPVKFFEDRSENYLTTTHGRDHDTDIEIGCSRDGAITALHVTTWANIGAYFSTIAAGVPTTLYGRIITGCYKIPNARVDVIGTYTNTAMTGAYRGAGRPEATYVIERVVDAVAAATGVDPAEVRRRNFIQPDDFPYENGVGMLPYDSGNYEGALDKALDMAGYADLRAEQRRRIEAGEQKLLGIGLSSYVEACGLAPSKWFGLGGEGWGAGIWESANIRVHLTGKVVVTTGASAHGQGHETTFAQVVSDRLGIPYDDIQIQHGDTLGTPFGFGTYGSRSLAVGGTAIYKSADKIIDKVRKLGAHMLEASESDVEFENGKVFVKGSPDSAKTIQEIAAAAHLAYDLPPGMEPFLDETTYFDPINNTFPFGTHICVVEVDRDSGEVEVIRYVAVDDFGNVVNPLIVGGQLHGGIAQGLAQALYEGARYDDDGQLLTGTLSDYAIPKASQVPWYELDFTVTPSPSNPMGVKGAGEAGTIASTPAVANAVVDAVRHMGIDNIQMPMTPERVWTAMNQAR